MSGKPGRSGRPIDPTLAAGYVAYQVRLPPPVAVKFAEAVRRRSASATGNEQALSKTAVLVGLVSEFIQAEGVTDADVSEAALREINVVRRPKPKVKAKKR